MLGNVFSSLEVTKETRDAIRNSCVRLTNIVLDGNGSYCVADQIEEEGTHEESAEVYMISSLSDDRGIEDAFDSIVNELGEDWNERIVVYMVEGNVETAHKICNDIVTYFGEDCGEDKVYMTNLDIREEL